MSKSLCIYHHNCADGFGAAWAVWKAHKKAGEEIDFFPGIYGQPPADCSGRNVILVDFSYKRDVMERIIASAKSVTILDHHKTAQAEIQPLLDAGKAAGVFDMEKSGAILAWNWFFAGEEPPQLLKHIEDRDLWRFALPKTREIQANLFSHPYDFEKWDALIEQCENPQKLAEFAYAGEAIERKHFKDIDELLGVTRREMNIGGYVVWAANLPYTMASDACELLCKTSMIDPRDGMATLEPPAFAATYYDGANGRFFSLRSRGEFDVSEIAKKYGGGGHKNASGFTMPIGWEGETNLKGGDLHGSSNGEKADDQKTGGETSFKKAG